MRKFSAIRFENVRFWEKPSLYALKALDLKKKPALYALKTLNFKLTLPSLGVMPLHAAPAAILYIGKRQHYTGQALLARILSIDQPLVSTSGPLGPQK